MDSFNFPSGVRESTRRVAVRKVDIDPMKEEEAAQMQQFGLIPRNSTMVQSQVFLYPNEQPFSSDYNNVRIFMTDKGAGRVRKWSDTRMIGTLRIILLEDVGVPITAIRLVAVDSNGLERGTVMEYELPLNFKFDASLSPAFTAIRISINGEYIGLLFSSEQSKLAFTEDLSQLSS
jgi:hypothetical protein